jgi:hypothetical protein
MNGGGGSVGDPSLFRLSPKSSAGLADTLVPPVIVLTIPGAAAKPDQHDGDSNHLIQRADVISTEATAITRTPVDSQRGVPSADDVRGTDSRQL